MEHQDITSLEKAIGYRFKRPALALEALRHRSYVNEQASPALADNERLEFLGDAVLNLVVSELLMERYPEMTEGDLSRARATLVNENQLADLAKHIGIGPMVQLGKGEIMSGGREKNSILSDTLEAIVAAVFLDGGLDSAYRVLRRRFGNLMACIDGPSPSLDSKSRLQELIQTRIHAVPRYRVVEEHGPDHDKTFCVELEVDGLVARGTGKSKKTAEQDAAREALNRLKSRS
ncbi:MAG: ribonuclease III [Desulfobacterales bacterium]|jgi:ribonuclease III